MNAREHDPDEKPTYRETGCKYVWACVVACTNARAPVSEVMCCVAYSSVSLVYIAKLVSLHSGCSTLLLC